MKDMASTGAAQMHIPRRFFIPVLLEAIRGRMSHKANMQIIARSVNAIREAHSELMCAMM
jgi:hypothetical protein